MEKICVQTSSVVSFNCGVSTVSNATVDMYLLGQRIVGHMNSTLFHVSLPYMMLRKSNNIPPAVN